MGEKESEGNLDVDASICEYALAVEATTTVRPIGGGLKVLETKRKQVRDNFTDPFAQSVNMPITLNLVPFRLTIYSEHG